MATTGASSSAAAPSVMSKFLGLLRNYREPVADADVREFFRDAPGEYEKLPAIINTLMGEVASSLELCQRTTEGSMWGCMDAQGKIKIFQKGSVLSYGLIGAEEAERIRGLT